MNRAAYYKFAAIIILVPLFCILMPSEVLSPKGLILGCILFTLPLLVLRAHWAIAFTITIMSLHFYGLGNHLAVYAPFLILISSLINKNGAPLFGPNPIRIFFFIYLISIIPSFINSSNQLRSIFLSFNIIAVFLLLELIAGIIKTDVQIKSITKIFLFWAFLNSLQIFWQAHSTHERVFGFTGVVFVDFACVAILILLSKFLFSQEKNKIGKMLLLSVISIALILTQTRNTLISLFLTLAVVVTYSWFFPKTLCIPRFTLVKKILTIVVIFVALIGVLFVAKPDSFKRHTELVSMHKTEHPKSGSGTTGLTSNTLGTRLMIWVTAVNGFIKHPIIGIGAYSFGFDSIRYNFLPKLLFKAFVENLSPHITYLAVLTETGIIGMVGFLLLIFFSLRVSFKSLNLSNTAEEKNISIGILLVHVYITFSMAFSDAWLWHQCAILWGFVLGISMANFRILKTDSEIINS